MNKGLKWMLTGIFLAVASIWCLLFGGAVLGWASVFLLILAIGFFAGGYGYGQQKDAGPPEYPTENNEKEQKS